jgi:hypothetical protein
MYFATTRNPMDLYYLSNYKTPADKARETKQTRTEQKQSLMVLA